MKYSEQDVEFDITLYCFSYNNECLYVVAPFSDTGEIRKYVGSEVFDHGGMDNDLFNDIWEKGEVSIMTPSDFEKYTSGDGDGDENLDTIPFAVDCSIKNDGKRPFFYYDEEFTVGELLELMKEQDCQ